MIPKIIHYCWFGKNPKPDIMIKCIESWRKYLPEWEIIEWTEDNYDINVCQYVRDAYEIKKWAFVSDYARLDILYKYGGIYLDIDVEFLKPLPDDYLNCSGILAFEYTKTVAPGLIFGANAGNEFIKSILKIYETERLSYEKTGIYKTINARITDALLLEGLKKNNQYQEIAGFCIYPSEYFCGYNTDIREPEITDNTIAWHHYLGSWSNPSLKMKIQDILKKVIGVKKYKRLLLFIRRIRGNESN